ncbi:hypothetical protein B9479_005330 [Cryptococcus floricola]|uniref:Uncharacterized protein n=1 Tax=Cryptococcus floricola TaxID=2591691 RepID=A0A5D3AW00_9TREE|nr:hypothetical protein B9479_005330 [Cryptococcus floricola]
MGGDDDLGAKAVDDLANGDWSDATVGFGEGDQTRDAQHMATFAGVAGYGGGEEEEELLDRGALGGSAEEGWGAPELEAIDTALRSFDSGTAAGISGWTVPLLRGAAQRPTVKKLLLLLATTIAGNTCKGRHMLRVSRLIPLAKPDGGIRPIAVGEMVRG